MKKNIIIFLLTLQITSMLNSKNIIFDLGGVLFDRSIMSSISHIGYFNIIKYILFERKSYQDLKDQFFNILDYKFPYPKNFSKVKITENDNDIPYPIYENFTGIRPANYILKDVKIAISKSNSSNLEKDILYKISDLILDPITHSSNYKPIPAGIEILKLCYEKGHKLYLLSTWEKKSFSILKKKNPEIFKLFSGKAISGKTGITKPDKKAYIELIEKYKLDINETIFIDDREENTKAAEIYGIKSIICKSLKTVYKELIKLCIIN